MGIFSSFLTASRIMGFVDKVYVRLCGIFRVQIDLPHHLLIFRPYTTSYIINSPLCVACATEYRGEKAGRGGKKKKTRNSGQLCSGPSLPPIYSTEHFPDPRKLPELIHGLFSHHRGIGDFVCASPSVLSILAHHMRWKTTWIFPPMHYPLDPQFGSCWFDPE